MATRRLHSRALLGAISTIFTIVIALGIYWAFAKSQTEKEGLPNPEIHPSLSQSEEPDALPQWFEDHTRGSGVDFICRNGEEANQFTLLESLGSGVGLLDFDGDGRLDIFIAGGGYFDGPDKKTIHGHECRLYRNLGNWKFENVTQQAGFGGDWFYNHGVAVADYDRDGWPDLAITGYGHLAIFRNVSDGAGGRRFQETTNSLGIRDRLWATSVAWADLNGDGFPDLYVCHYADWSFANDIHCPAYSAASPRDVCSPDRFKPQVHSLFLNENGKRFRDIGSENNFPKNGYGLGVVLADLNGDRKPDIYVANDASNNFLFVNRKGKFKDIGWQSGVAVDDDGRYTGSMGVDVGDYDGSGRASIWVTNYQGDLHALYRNLGRGPGEEAFDFQSRAVGVAAIGSHMVGFGTAFIDADNDGWEDLVIVAGHVVRFPSLGSTFKQKPALFHNVSRNGRRFFEVASKRGGEFFRTPALGRGLALGDLDNDGWPDLVVTNINSPTALLRNVAGRSQPKSRWIGFKLDGRDHRDLVGSTLVVEGASRKLTRFVKGGGSYLSSSDPRLLLGLADNEPIRKITVNWSWGKSQTWDALEPNTYWELSEGTPTAKRLLAPQ